MAALPAKLIVVKRNRPGAFAMLTDWLKAVPDVQIVWDRRSGDDRRRRADRVQAEGREANRRRAPAPSWNVFMPLAPNLWSVYWYLATRAAAAATREPSQSF